MEAQSIPTDVQRQKPPLHFGYWAIRGLGNSIRHVLHYTGTPYREKTYKFEPADSAQRRAEWLTDKPCLNLDFPNLPHLIDGPVKITQSVAILRYLARRSGILPTDDAQRTRLDVIEQHLNDLLWENIRLCYDPGYDSDKRDAYLNRFLNERVPSLTRFLGDRRFLVGDQASHVDFLAYEALDQHRALWPDVCGFEDQPSLLAYLQRIEALPGFREYRTSSMFVSWPVWSERASYGGPDTARPATSDIVKKRAFSGEQQPPHLTQC